ncbi:hypothetical protein I4P06_21370 [Enterobacter asburiae]|uniref:hypothetical protein n=1 Tax=Enterobacter asburiae TaxID=61645 RepID=UPI0018C24B91|nr:hypothetical protein [Enterobacter asburiae]MBG0640534.1 hypothetical protein [Enterobacter asburiae]
MNAEFKKKWVAVVTFGLFIISTGIMLYKRLQQPGLNINCSTILHYDHSNPDYISTLELTFRLDSDFEGLVVLSGNINTATGRQTVSRNITFDYNIKAPGEIVVSDMRHIKTARDTADDEIIKKSFFFVPEGTERQLRLSPSGNAWLLGNPQSPFALCVNQK